MKAMELRGEVFGKWTVLKRSAKRSYWECLCECGTIKEVFHGHLKSGASTSCGCFTYDHKHPLYSVWRGMKVRTVGTTAHKYKNYGGRGIGMCPEWAASFHTFRDWAIGAGWKDGLTIERKNVEVGYAPDNCEWIPLEKQNYNKRNTTYIVLGGERVSLALAAKKAGVKYVTARKRLERGWKPEDILSPKDHRKES